MCKTTKYNFQAQDLLDRIIKYQYTMTRDQLISMIEEDMHMLIQDHINEENFAGIPHGQIHEEVKVLLNKSAEHLEKSESYIDAAFFATSDLERQTKEETWLQTKLGLIELGTLVRNIKNKLGFLIKQAKLE